MADHRSHPTTLVIPAWTPSEPSVPASGAFVTVRPSPTLTTVVLLAADVVAVVLGALVAVWVVNSVEFAGDAGRVGQFAPLLALLPLGYALMGLYPAAGTGPVEEMRRILTFTSASYSTLTAFLILAFPFDAGHVLALASAGLATCVLVPTGRSAVRHLCAWRPWWGVPVVLVGAGKTAKLIAARLTTFVGLNLKPVAALDDDPRKHDTDVVGVPVVGALADAPEVKRRYRANHAIVAMPGVEAPRVASLVHQMGRTFSNVVVIPNTFGMTSIGVGTRDSGGIVGLYVLHHLTLRRNRVAKRVFDLLLLLPLGLVALPVVALCALAVFVVSPGNPFYRQEREGYRGKPIRIWKLRTMCRDADAALARYLEENPDAREEWNTHFKLAKDPRILPGIGRMLRRLSLDELPQILNILMGELSFVGPRPFPYYHLEQFDEGFRELRTSVVPGLTGYWQVTSRSTADLLAQVELDSYYIKNWSLWLDLYVIARTPWAVFFGPGAY